MPRYVDPRQIQQSLERAGLAYTQALNPELPAQLALWLDQLLAAPRNLTAIRDPRAAIAKHVLEPLVGRHRLLGADLPVPHGPLLDIGSGNGAPGLPFALCEPDRAAVLLDARAGTADFLRGVVTQLDTPQLSIRQERAERAAHSDDRARFALVLSRAAAPPAVALELMLPFLQVGGVAALWTGALSARERARLAGVAAALGATLTPLDPPAGLVVATQLRLTAPRYPRPWNQIRRRPLSAAQDLPIS